MLAALVEEGHDDCDSSGFSPYSGDDTFQILIVVVGRHVVFMAAYGVGKAVICHIHHKKQIVTTDRMPDSAFGFTAAETGSVAFHQIGVSLVAPEGNIIFMFVFPFRTEPYKVAVYHFSKFPAAFQRNHAQRAGGDSFIVSFVTLHGKVLHKYILKMFMCIFEFGLRPGPFRTETAGYVLPCLACPSFFCRRISFPNSFIMV